jgi:hypothetical protein
MSADQPPGHDEDWLRGLGGAPADEPGSAAFAEGRRLRAGLDRVPQVDASRADWADVLRRAGQGSPAQLSKPEAANAGRWRRAAGLAAVLVLAVGLVWQQRPDPEPQWRGEGSIPGEARWLSAAPIADAAALASELRSWGAEVRDEPAPQGQVLLSIRCPANCDVRVAARLAELETALAPDGSLRLHVLAR